MSHDRSCLAAQVLDPEQNAAFLDTYLGLPFDLSSALFVATANRAFDIPPPLLDRLEVVQLGGYTLEEKVRRSRRLSSSFAWWWHGHGIPLLTGLESDAAGRVRG